MRKVGKNLALIAIFLFLLIIGKAKALSLGTVVKKEIAYIKIGETAKFEIIFWNVEEEPYKIELEVKEAPKDWTIFIQPKEFLLSTSTGNQHMSLPYTDKNVKAFQVNIFVKPEKIEKGGRYEITLTAKAGSPEKGISFFQERDFKLFVYLTGAQEKIEKIEPFEKNETNLQSGKLIEEIDLKPLFAILATILILLLSLIIYKYA